MKPKLALLPQSFGLACALFAASAAATESPKAAHTEAPATNTAVAAAPTPLPSDEPPPPAREFRGLWIATVDNIDWPSRPGLTTAMQQAELRTILDRAAALRLNAVILQVRPDCDAFYDSSIEPWSEGLTGLMGRPPNPWYDPLAFAVSEAHRRGLELHAWFNPFRLRGADAKTPASRDYAARLHPEWVRPYGKTALLDPGEEQVRAYSLGVILDVVRRYDIDGVHFDDHFYPYPESVNNNDLEFPDGPTYARYQAGGGKLSRSDWRRGNIDQFINSVNMAVKAEKPWVKFGVSPFGIWRPKNPSRIRGLDAYESLSADSRLWLANGWVDYLAPQLYWPVDSKEQSFTALLQWWATQNVLHRHLWPGMKLGEWKSLSGGDPAEVAREIEATRQQAGATGNILWHAKPFTQNDGGVADTLGRLYTESALVPASPWLGNATPPPPVLTVHTNAAGTGLRWLPRTMADPWLWVLEKKIQGHWTAEILPGREHETTWAPAAGTGTLEAAAVGAVDRCGNLSAWAVQRVGRAP